VALYLPFIPIQWEAVANISGRAICSAPCALMSFIAHFKSQAHFGFAQFYGGFIVQRVCGDFCRGIVCPCLA